MEIYIVYFGLCVFLVVFHAAPRQRHHFSINLQCRSSMENAGHFDGQVVYGPLGLANSSLLRKRRNPDNKFVESI